MSQIRTNKMLIRVCDKCRCELSNDAPTVFVGRQGDTTIYDLCKICLSEVFAGLTGRKPQAIKQSR